MKRHVGAPFSAAAALFAAMLVTAAAFSATLSGEVSAAAGRRTEPCGSPSKPGCRAAGFSAGASAVPAAERATGEAAGERDTLILYDCERVEPDGFRTVVKAYAVNDRTSAEFRRFLEIADPQSAVNRSDFEANLQLLRQSSSAKLRHHDLQGCPTLWLPLCRARGTYYFDGLHPYPVCIADSLVVLQMQDGPWTGRLVQFERPAADRFRFRACFPDRGGMRCRTFDLFVIDPARRIAVLQEEGEPRFRLFAAAESVGIFDLLAWELTELTTGREVLETIDFDALLRPFKLKVNE